MAKKTRRQLAAILSADAVGYSRRMAEDEGATVDAIRAHRLTIGGFVREHRGRVVDAVGDNLLAEFASAVDVVACALAVQAELAARDEALPEDRRLRFRIGLHLGDLIVEDEQIFGDGINVAARLEALAAPGGICASGAVVEQVRGKVDATFEDLGEQTLKNIPAPVRVYRVRPPGDLAGTVPESLTVAGFAGRPAIAILPFENAGGDPDQRFLADGIAEDLIARLSAFRLFPVISRSSTFTYAGKRVDARQVSRELRARYVVTGSVVRAGTRLRVTVDLVDGALGHQLDSSRYDRELGDVFALQDQIVDDLVSTVEPALQRAERQRARSKAPAQLDAWESFHRGSWLLFTFRAREDLEEALRLFRRSRELDPMFSTAAAFEAIAHSTARLFQWPLDPDGSAFEAMRAAQAAVDLDEDDPWAHAALGYASHDAGNVGRAVAEFERAIERNPSLTVAYQGLALALSGDRPDEAVRVMEKVLRLSPRDPQQHLFRHQLAVAQLTAGRYDEALRQEEQSLRLRTDQPHVYRVLAAAYGHLGRGPEAVAALETMLRLAPHFSIESFRRANSKLLVERCLEGWRLAGWTRW